MKFRVTWEGGGWESDTFSSNNDEFLEEECKQLQDAMLSAGVDEIHSEIVGGTKLVGHTFALWREKHPNAGIEACLHMAYGLWAADEEDCAKMWAVLRDTYSKNLHPSFDDLYAAADNEDSSETQYVVARGPYYRAKLHAALLGIEYVSGADCLSTVLRHIPDYEAAFKDMVHWGQHEFEMGPGDWIIVDTAFQ